MVLIGAELAAGLAALEADHPGWHVWLSDRGRWWAVRRGATASYSREDCRPMTVDADNAAGLRELLERIDGGRAGAL